MERSKKAVWRVPARLDDCASRMTRVHTRYIAAMYRSFAFLESLGVPWIRADWSAIRLTRSNGAKSIVSHETNSASASTSAASGPRVVLRL